MTSSIPAVFTELLSLATQSVAGVQDAVVADGWSDDIGSTMFGIGAETPPFFVNEVTNVDATPTWDGLGGLRINEDYTIPCYIYVGTGTDDNSTVRTAAFAIWDIFWPLFKGAMQAGSLTNRYAEIPRFSATGPRTAEEAQGGRYCLIQFWVHCLNVI